MARAQHEPYWERIFQGSFVLQTVINEVEVPCRRVNEECVGVGMHYFVVVVCAKVVDVFVCAT